MKRAGRFASGWQIVGLLLVACLAGCGGERSAVEKREVEDLPLRPNAGGTVIRKTDDERSGAAAAQPDRPLQKGDTFVVSFARPMAAAADLDRPVESAPVRLEPALPFQFRWKSPTEGEVAVTGVPAPATRYRLRLCDGLRDAAGQAVRIPEWGIQWPEALFGVAKATDYDSWQWESESRPALPSLPLEFSHPVAAVEVGRTVFWRDETGRTTGSEVQLEPTSDPKWATRFTVTPRQPLAAGHRYELLVEDTRCAIDGSTLDYVHLFPVGRTEPLHIEYVRGLNQPKRGAYLEIRFNQALDRAGLPPQPVKVEPAVANLRSEVEWSTLRVFGDFKPGLRYGVEIARGVRSRRGFQLDAAETWHARFREKRAAVILPRSLVTTSARQGLRVEFVQVNTGPLHWQLAQVPLEKVAAVRVRLNEYRELDEAKRDPVTNEMRMRPTELLVSGLQLPVVAEGDCEAGDVDREVPRSVNFPSAKLSEGLYLFEIAGTTHDGRVAGNRALVLVNREFLVWKATPRQLIAGVFDVVSGEPVVHADVQLLADNGTQLGNGATDGAGQVELPRPSGAAVPELVILRRGPTFSAHFLDLSGGLPSLEREETEARPVALRQWLFSDRGIYRPGETIKVKGIVRAVRENQLALPEADTVVPWQLVRSAQDEPLVAGEARLNAAGAWETEIVLPAAVPVGHYSVRALGTSCAVKVDEFRAPAFSTELVSLDRHAAGENRVRVLSRYFHGAPNARAAVRWRAVWTPYSISAAEGLAEPGQYLCTSDEQSPDRELRRPRWQRDGTEEDHVDEAAWSRSIEGTAVLDDSGAAELASVSPFAAPQRLAAAGVHWEVTVVAADGQTVEAENDAVVPLARAQPAVGLSASPGAHEVEVAATALDPAGELVAGVPLTLELYRVEEKSVRENLSRHVVRYRNTPVFTRIATREGVAPFRVAIPVGGTGRFVAVVALAGPADPPRASGDVVVTGPAPAEFAQWDDSTFAAEPDRTDYPVGAIAHIALRAPFAGPAWVTVETDRLLSSRLVTLTGNAANIEISVTAAMHPNAHVVVYLFRPESLGAPADRVGRCEIQVRRPDTELQVAIRLAAPKVEPGEAVTGTVAVTTEGRPAAGAEVTVFAVDEAVLRYGHWELGSARDVFFPQVPHEVETRSGLRQFGPRPTDEPLFQKGFLLGDGGPPPAVFRRRFASLAFWQGSVRTDDDGKAVFSFAAPDNLTAYRIVAVAYRAAEQFGHGEAQIEVARKLQAEPVLPRFVRAGDEVELRVILRQSEWPRARGRVGCSVEGATLLGAAEAVADLDKAIPVPVAFRVRVGDGPGPLRVRLNAQAENGSGARDAVEVTVPVKAARIVRRETTTGVLPATGWRAGEALPAEWRRGQGAVDLVVSSSPWLPLFDGLPRLLDYPHGCNEQISARVLAYGLMADLLAALPDAAARTPEYRRRVEAGLAILARAQLPDGAMPYWAGTKEENSFVTIQTAWAAAEAERSGFVVPRRLTEGLRSALTRMARREDRVRLGPSLRAFALMVAATLEPGRKLRAEALELYQQRDGLDDDGRAFLALALHRFGIMPEEKLQLVAELGTEPPLHAFEPAWLGSAARTEALRLCARAEIASGSCTTEARAAQRRQIDTLMESSPNFSTQENLWLLLAFRAFAKGEVGEGVGNWTLPAAEPLLSADGRAAGWYSVPLADFPARFALPVGTSGGQGSYLLRATFHSPDPEQRSDRGFRIERVVRNLTEPKRDGSGAAPFALGDELLVTFRVFAERSQAYVALEESLPAAVETIDPEYLRLTLREKIDSAGGDAALQLSHWEKRDDRTLWYFDQVGAGTISYSAVVRVTAAGRFQWPGAAISPMYDHRFSGVSEGGTIEVR